MSTSQNRNELEAMLNEEDTLESRLVFHATNYAEREHFLDQKDSYQTSWLLPYLDRESLIEEPLLFLSLLHARTEYLPVSCSPMFPQTDMLTPFAGGMDDVG